MGIKDFFNWILSLFRESDESKRARQRQLYREKREQKIYEN